MQKRVLDIWSTMLCHKVYSDDGWGRHKATMRENSSHIAAVIAPEAIGEESDLFELTNPPKKLDGNRASRAKGGIIDSGSSVLSAKMQRRISNIAPDTAETTTPKSEESITLFIIGVSSDTCFL